MFMTQRRAVRIAIASFRLGLCAKAIGISDQYAPARARARGMPGVSSV